MKLSRRRKILLVLAGVVSLLALWLVEEHFRGKWALAAWEKEARARGEKITMEEVIPPVPNPEDNGAKALAAAANKLDRRVPSDFAPLMLFIAPGKVLNVTRWRTGEAYEAATRR